MSSIQSQHEKRKLKHENKKNADLLNGTTTKTTYLTNDVLFNGSLIIGVGILTYVVLKNYNKINKQNIERVFYGSY